MPAKSKAQQQFMGAELTRTKKGKKTKTEMSKEKLEEYASVKHKKLPERKTK